VIKAQVLEIDTERRRLKLGIKQLVPTSIDEYVAEHQVGDIVSGRVIDVSGNSGVVELGEGIRAICRIAAAISTQGTVVSSQPRQAADLASLTSLLQARWKSGPAPQSKPHELRAGQVCSFRITNLDRGAKKIEVELAST
jgi:small subunit ribosomal protein S1